MRVVDLHVQCLAQVVQRTQPVLQRAKQPTVRLAPPRARIKQRMAHALHLTCGALNLNKFVDFLS